jgi:hypothetical protein
LWSFVTSLLFMVRSYQPHAQPPSWRTTPCRLSATAYYILYNVRPLMDANCTC